MPASLLHQYRRSRISCCLVSLAATLLMTASAQAVEVVRGSITQGGMVILKAAADSWLSLDGKPLRLSPQGLAVIGFHRDDNSTVSLVEHRSDGTMHTLQLAPTTRKYLEQRIDGLPKAMVTPPQAVLDRIKRDREAVIRARSHDTALDAFAGGFRWPVRGIVTGVYGSRRILNGKPRAPHYGIDIAAAAGTPVIAPQAGIIRMVEDLYFTGWTVILDHGHGITSAFLHLKQAMVSPGQQVAAGAVIGHVGSTGRSTGAHLDWRINWFGKRLDPQLIAGPMPKD